MLNEEEVEASTDSDREFTIFDPIQIFAEIAHANNWVIDTDDLSDTRIGFNVEFSGRVFPTEVEYSPQTSEVYVLFLASLIAPPKSEPNLCSFLNKCSFKTSGYFLYHAERNVIIWKYGMAIAGMDGICPEQVVQVLSLGHQACAYFVDVIHQLAMDTVSSEQAKLMTALAVGSA